MATHNRDELVAALGALSADEQDAVIAEACGGQDLKAVATAALRQAARGITLTPRSTES